MKIKLTNLSSFIIAKLLYFSLFVYIFLCCNSSMKPIVLRHKNEAVTSSET